MLWHCKKNSFLGDDENLFMDKQKNWQKKFFFFFPKSNFPSIQNKEKHRKGVENFFFSKVKKTQQAHSFCFEKMPVKTNQERKK